MISSDMTAIDLFCGAGGLSEGLSQSGFQVLAGNDFNEAAGATYSATHANAKFLGGPVQGITAQDLLKAARLKYGQLDVLVGGPPCQAYSVYNHQRGMHDDRSQLFKEYLRLVEGLKPKFVVMENVMGILSAGEGVAVNAILEGLNTLGYKTEFKVLKAEEYGVPQERRRVIFLANRVGAPIHWPEISHGKGLKPFTTIEAAIADLPKVENGQDASNNPYKCKSQSWYQTQLRKNSNGVYNHSAPKLGNINLQRLTHIPQGGSWRDIPYELLPAGMKKAKRSDHTKRYGRLLWDGLASTILTKCDIHWGAYIHPEQDRSLTVREAARLQSFPDWFKFEGSQTEQYAQVGNAVPPMLGAKIAEAILEAAHTYSRQKTMAA